MLKTNKKLISSLLLSLVAGGIAYFSISGYETTMAMTVTAMTVFMIACISTAIIVDKKDRLEESKELRMRRLMRAEIDGVVDIQKQQGDHTYKVYTVYMVEYGKTASKIVHVGDYQRIDMEGQTITLTTLNKNKG